MVQKRQQIIESAKKEQRLEFDHLLDFEREKNLKKLKQFEDHEKQLMTSSRDQHNEFSTIRQNLESEIRQLNDDLSALKQELALQRDQIQKSATDSSEEKFKQLLSRYKDKYQADVKRSQELNEQLQQQLKQKEMEMNEMSFKYKRLESQLQQRLLQTMNRPAQTTDQASGSAKVLRHRSGQ